MTVGTVIHRLLLAVLAAGLLSFGSAAKARYVQPESKEVPVERVIANLERQLRAARAAANPRLELDLLDQIGRANAMAYATGSETLRVRADTEEPYVDRAVRIPIPWESVESTKKGPIVHLDRALAAYDELLAWDHLDLSARLGRAWCLEQKGEAEAAIDDYRKIVNAAWELEKDAESFTLFQHQYVLEAGQRLLSLLDSGRHADEIEQLRARLTRVAAISFPVSPILVPLADDLGLGDLLDTTVKVPFDLDGSGLGRSWRWITTQAAWLVWDPFGRGSVDSGRQLFGNVTFWIFWENGYRALAALDDNGDGEVAGQELEGLALWRDADGDGISDPGEVRPLADWGVVGLATQHEAHAEGFPFSLHGVRFDDGNTRPTYDWFVPPAPAQVSQEMSR